MPWIVHVGLTGGPVLVSQEQYDDIYFDLGWTITSPPPDGVSFPPDTLVHFAGIWAPSTQYAKGALLITPDGGLIVAYQDQLTDTSFSTTGFTVLPAGGSGSSGDVLAF